MNSLVLLARWPEEGRVKTRLSPALPPALACALHRAMLEDALWAALESAADRRALGWADAPAARGGMSLPAGIECFDQRGADLGERLAGALGERLVGSRDRAVAIGADCPEITADDLDRAFEALADHDLAIGPCPDGGFWLVGLSRPAPGLFAGVEWGGPAVLGRILDNAGAARLSVARLPTRADVDTPADLVRLIGALASRQRAARFTRAVLGAIELLPGPAGGAA